MDVLVDTKTLQNFSRERCYCTGFLLKKNKNKARKVSRCCSLSSRGHRRSVVKFVAGAILPHVEVCVKVVTMKGRILRSVDVQRKRFSPCLLRLILLFFSNCSVIFTMSLHTTDRREEEKVRAEYGHRPSSRSTGGPARLPVFLSGLDGHRYTAKLHLSI